MAKSQIKIPAKLRICGINQLPSYPFILTERGVYRRPLAEALKHPRIQLNASNSTAVVTIDVDSDSWIAECARRRERNLAVPSWIVYRYSNHRSHVAFVLKIPVHKNAESSRRALWYLSAITAYLQESFNGDPGYTALITRNPIFKSDELCTQWENGKHARRSGHTLKQLAHGMPDEIEAVSRKRLLENSIGRNCSMFDTLMKIAGSKQNRSLELLPVALTLNAQFEHSLPECEIATTVKSVERYRRNWIYYDHSPAKQADRGRKGGKIGSGRNGGLASGIVRANGTKMRNTEIINSRANGSPVSELADEFGLNRKQIWRICNMNNLHR